MDSTSIFLILVGVLFLLAISDLVVGVSNDAINFLNSAIGAKAASFRVIMIVAAVGIFIGATSSAGMMEIARKGIFHPEYFYFREIMIIFLAVMITDVILLDFFNTIGLPTSTTVSIVFELLGAAFAIALVYYLRGNMIEVNGVMQVGSVQDYINNEKALQIILGILLSIIIAFTLGAIIQWLSRLVFTFRYEKVLRYAGGVWGGLAITSIVYFLMIKGAKGASFMSEEVVNYITGNTTKLLLISFVSFSIFFQILTFFIKKYVLNIIVLVGTFALAMAFAGNDLVNFIGVPL
ncbi:MAG: inorganic phosphate transporter, partial [Bacteroidales bacterium]|nr:inorganic phosphate transporter [Bacteroidales bacterium]